MSKRPLPSHSPGGRLPLPMSSKRLCLDTSPPSGPVPTFALASVPRRPVLPVPRGIHGGVSKPGFKFWYDQRGHPLPFRRLCSLPMPKLLPLLPLDDEAGQSLRQTTTITDAESLEMYYKMVTIINNKNILKNGHIYIKIVPILEIILFNIQENIS